MTVETLMRHQKLSFITSKFSVKMGIDTGYDANTDTLGLFCFLVILITGILLTEDERFIWCHFIIFLEFNNCFGFILCSFAFSARQL